MSWLVWELGTDETVNYREQDFAEVYKDKPFDFIFDSIGGMAAHSMGTSLAVLCLLCYRNF
jgi:NADPH:quinone reductase-like Zn-dependent oxidoreductase